MPQSRGGDGHVGPVAVGAGGQFAHVADRCSLTARPAQHHAGAEHLVPFPDHGGTDLEGFSCYRLSGAAPALQDGLDVQDGNASYHPLKLPTLDRCARGGSPAVDRAYPGVSPRPPCPRPEPSPRPPPRRRPGSELWHLVRGIYSGRLGSLPVRAIRRFTVRAALPESLAPLRDLTLNLRWSWHAETRDLFAAIDPGGWEASGHDPVALLGEVPPAQLESLGHDHAFLRRLDDAARDLEQYLSGPRWYQQHADGGPRGYEQHGAGAPRVWDGAGSEGARGPGGPPAAIAYFSPEYGITQALPQ